MRIKRSDYILQKRNFNYIEFDGFRGGGRFRALLKEDFTDSYQKYIEIFELNGRYEYHKYKVIKMINKRKQYPDSRIRDLTQKTEEEVKQDLFGEYLFENTDLHKRSLSKLTKDIAEEFELTKDSLRR